MGRWRGCGKGERSGEVSGRRVEGLEELEIGALSRHGQGR